MVTRCYETVIPSDIGVVWAWRSHFHPATLSQEADKKKKEVDLTANPLVNVNSKQPDKELFDKA